MLERLTPKIARLAEHLQRMRDLPARRRRAPARLHRRHRAGARYATRRSRSRGKKNAAFASAQLRAPRGVWLRPLANVIVIIPPLSITLDELDQICDAVEWAIRRSFEPL